MILRKTLPTPACAFSKRKIIKASETLGGAAEGLAYCWGNNERWEKAGDQQKQQRREAQRAREQAERAARWAEEKRQREATRPAARANRVKMVKENFDEKIRRRSKNDTKGLD